MASSWNMEDKELAAQQAHARERQALLKKRAIALHAEGLALKLISERLGIGVRAVLTLVTGQTRSEKEKRHRTETSLLTPRASSVKKRGGTKP